MGVALVSPVPLEVGLDSDIVAFPRLVGIGSSEVFPPVISSDVVVVAADSSVLLEVMIVLFNVEDSVKLPDEVSLVEVVTALCGIGGTVVVEDDEVGVSGSSPPGSAVSVIGPPGPGI